MELDALDRIASEAFEGYLVRKDLLREFKGQYPVPTYVAEFLLGRYCASVEEDEIQEGLAIVSRQLASRTVRAGKELVGDRDPRAHELTIQFSAFDACKSAAATGIPILLAMSSVLVEMSLEGGLVIIGGLNLGGSIEPIYNAVSIVELAADKGAQKILIPVSARKQLFQLPDDLATRIIVVYYADVKDALIKVISD